MGGGCEKHARLFEALAHCGGDDRLSTGSIDAEPSGPFSAIGACRRERIVIGGIDPAAGKGDDPAGEDHRRRPPDGKHLYAGARVAEQQNRRGVGDGNGRRINLLGLNLTLMCHGADCAPKRRARRRNGEDG